MWEPVLDEIKYTPEDISDFDEFSASVSLFENNIFSNTLNTDNLKSEESTCIKKTFKAIAEQLNQWQIKPNGTEGYRTAEVTLGGVNVDEVSSQTMQSKRQPGLFFIGEVLDVTGWLGGYNFQWAWSSGHAAGQAVWRGARPKARES